MTRTERTYYLVFGLYSISGWFLAPMYALFLISRGLDLFEMNLVLATFLVAVTLLEVPTGAFADVAGRKLSFLLSCVVRMFAFGLYAFAHNFTDCVIAELIDAVGNTLANGALDAWAVDGMRAEGEPRLPDHFFARAQMLSRGAMIAGGVACGYIAERDIAYPWLVAAAGFGITAIVAAVTMREVRSAAPLPSTSARRSFVGTMREGWMSVRHTPVLLVLCALTLATAFGQVSAGMFWQPRMQRLTGEGVWLMGWIWALLNVASVVGSAIIPRVLGHVRREHALAAAALWRSVMLAAAALATGFGPALVGFLLQEMSFGFSEPLMQGWMNERIPTVQRATILSVRAMFFTLGGGAGLICLGVVARDLGIPAAWLMSALVLAGTVPGFVLLGRLAESGGANPPDVEPVRLPATPPALG